MTLSPLFCKTTLLSVAASAILFAAPPMACAHGDEDHPRATAPMRKEQKPWGIAGDAASATRTVELGMSDAMRFTPDRVEVKQGETVRFVLKNGGQLKHELVLGTKKVLDEHAALMQKFPDMEHDEPYMLHVPPGKTGELVWTFNRAGDVDFACLIAGHYQAGMVGRIVVKTKGDRVAVDGVKLSLMAADADMTDGEVRKVDRENLKITLKHGEIRNLDMPPMTMVFQVGDEALLAKVKPGDKVRFKAANQGGKLVLTEIEIAK